MTAHTEMAKLVLKELLDRDLIAVRSNDAAIALLLRAVSKADRARWDPNETIPCFTMCGTPGEASRMCLKHATQIRSNCKSKWTSLPLDASPLQLFLLAKR